MGLEHGLLPVWGVLIFHIAPGLPSLNITQPPAAQVCGRLCPVRSPSPPQVPVRDSKAKLYLTTFRYTYDYEYIIYCV